MTNDDALEVLRKLVYDGYRLFECQEAWQTLNTAVLGTTHNKLIMPCPICRGSGIGSHNSDDLPNTCTACHGTGTA